VLEYSLFKNEQNWQLLTSIQVQKKNSLECARGKKKWWILFCCALWHKIKEWYKEHLFIICATTLPLVAINCFGCRRHDYTPLSVIAMMNMWWTYW